MLIFVYRVWVKYPLETQLFRCFRLKKHTTTFPSLNVDWLVCSRSSMIYSELGFGEQAICQNAKMPCQCKAILGSFLLMYYNIYI